MTDTLFNIEATACPVKPVVPNPGKPYLPHVELYIVLGRWRTYPAPGIPSRIAGEMPAFSLSRAEYLAEQCRDCGWHSLEIVTIPATGQEAKS